MPFKHLGSGMTYPMWLTYWLWTVCIRRIDAYLIVISPRVSVDEVEKEVRKITLFLRAGHALNNLNDLLNGRLLSSRDGHRETRPGL
jgi:hypothetical protein